MSKELSNNRTNNIIMVNISKAGLVSIMMLIQNIANKISVWLKILQIFNTKWQTFIANLCLLSDVGWGLTPFNDRGQLETLISISDLLVSAAALFLKEAQGNFLHCFYPLYLCLLLGFFLVMTHSYEKTVLKIMLHLGFHYVLSEDI